MKEFAPGPDNEMSGRNAGMGGEDERAAALQAAMLDAVSDAIGAALIVYDRNDQLVYVSRTVGNYLPVTSQVTRPGTRLRDFLGAVYDGGGRDRMSAGEGSAATREEWIAEQISVHWRERFDTQRRDAKNRWARFSKRRLPSGYGICIISDISEQKKREEQWRADVERVQLTEEILDNLPHPVFVQDRNLSVVAVNKSFCSRTDARAESVLGGALNEIFTGDLGAKLDRATRHVLETGASAAILTELPSDPAGEWTVVRSQRVGKPGRYFIVTSFEAASAQFSTDTVGGPSSDNTVVTSSASYTVLPENECLRFETEVAKLAGRKALIVTMDLDFEAKSLKTLERLGIDVCCVRNATEEDAFLTVARSVGVTIDLMVVDTQMDVKCLELALEEGISTITLDGFQLDTELAFLVLNKLAARDDKQAAAADDWEITTTEAEPLAPEVPSRERSLVLVAEDNEINQIVFSQILEGLGHSYRIARDGAEAVRLWQELKPAVVLMDITLPVMNGFEACRKIRELADGPAGMTPVIGVLVQAFDRDREECMVAGMNDVILKPLSPDAVDAVLKRHVPALQAVAAG